MFRRVPASKNLGADLIDSINAENEKKFAAANKVSLENTVHDYATGRYIFFANEFAKLMRSYANYSLTYRIKNAIIQHSVRKANSYHFYLYWETENKHIHPLKVTLTCGTMFSPHSSRFLATEENFLELVSGHQVGAIKSEQMYYSIMVEEVTCLPLTLEDIARHRATGEEGTKPYSSAPNLPLLKWWFNVDGGAGELHHVAPGDGICGNEALRIYEYFAEFLLVDKMLICDAATLEDQQGTANIPLRLITALADGKTWFEKHLPGIRLFESPAIKVDQYHTVNQNNESRAESLAKLRALKLRDWHGLLNESQQQQLLALRRKYFPPLLQPSSSSLVRLRSTTTIKRIEFADETLGELAAAIYHESQQKHVLTDALKQLNDLLCGTIMLEFGSVPLSTKAKDYAVKSRVHKLLWGSYIWTQQLTPPNAKDEHVSKVKGGL